MSGASNSGSGASSPAGSTAGFTTPETGRALIHDAQLKQLAERLGQLEESFPGFGLELVASLPGLPEDDLRTIISILSAHRRTLVAVSSAG